MPLTFNSEWSKPFVGSYAENFIDSSANDESDVGPGSFRETETKMRRRFSYTRRATSKAEYDAIIAFIRSVRGRVNAFYWYHHFEQQLILVRFGETLPTATPIFGEDAWDFSITVDEE